MPGVCAKTCASDLHVSAEHRQTGQLSHLVAELVRRPGFKPSGRPPCMVCENSRIYHISFPIQWILFATENFEHLREVPKIGVIFLERPQSELMEEEED